MALLFEYDRQKNDSNKNKHGIYLAEAAALWDAPHAIFPARHVGGEARWIIVGKIHGRIYVAIFAYRGLTIRLISLHKADTRWQAEYERTSDEEKTN